MQVGQDFSGRYGRGLGNKVSYHNVGVLVEAANRVSLQGNEFGDNVEPIMTLNGGNQLPGVVGSPVLHDLQSTAWGRSQIRITGTVTNAGPNHEYWVDVYATPYWDMTYDAAGNGSGHQMRTFLGRTLITTDGSGRATLDFTVSESMELGDHISVMLTSNRYNDGSTVGVFHGRQQHDVDLTSSPTSGSPTVTPGGSTGSSGGSSGGASTPGRTPVAPRG